MAVAGNNRRSHSHDDRQKPAPGLAILPLGIAIVITLALTIYPPLVTNASGKADHLAATLAFWAMSAGYVRGVGFVPKNRGLRLAFSTAICVLALMLSVALVVSHGVAP